MGDVYTVDEAAEILKLHPKTVRRKISTGEIEAVKVGRQYRITKSHLNSLCGVAKEEIKSSKKENYISSTIDVENVEKEDGISLTNMLMAALKPGTGNDYVNCIYFEDAKRLKIMVNTTLDSAPELISMIRGLVAGIKGKIANG